MEDSMPLIHSKIPTQKEIQFLEDMVYEYNATQLKKDDGKLFSKLIYDAENNIIAGISGWTWANACEITLLWVNEEFRKKGYGRILLNAAEEEAKKENCKAILLRTYSFQAPYFYLKHGFGIDHETKDFPTGYSDFCMIKRLDK